MRLTDRTAIVTGGGAGIGRAISLAFAREGCKVLVTDRHEDAARLTTQAIGDAGGEALPYRLDVAKLNEHPNALERVTGEWGRLDILVNNAGIQERRPLFQMDEDLWERIIGVNLKAPYFLAQAAAKMMAPNRYGKIINIASVQDDWPLRDNSIYGISKGGMRMLTKCLALELAEYRINVNSISPGAIATDMNRETLDDPEAMKRMEAQVPLGRFGQAEEIANAAVYLASGESDYATGATFYVDGGLLLDRL